MSKKSRQSDDTQSARALIQPVKRASMLQRLRNNFLTGIVVVAPFGITAFLTWSIVDYVDQQVLPQILPLIPEAYRPENLLPFYLPGLGLLVFVLFIITIGSLTKNFFGREIVRIGERWVDRMPVVRSLYNALKQIAETIFTQSKSSFEKACLVEYPRKGIWAIAFVSTSTSGEVPDKAVKGGDMLSVFLPTTPNPTSGFLLFLPREDVILLDMTVEEAAKMVISAGLVTPQSVADKIAPKQVAANKIAAETHGPEQAASSPGAPDHSSPDQSEANLTGPGLNTPDHNTQGQNTPVDGASLEAPAIAKPAPAATPLDDAALPETPRNHAAENVETVKH